MRTLNRDALGNITGWQDSHKMAVKTFAYDALNRLTQFRQTQANTQPLQQQIFSYDANGNRLTLTDGTTDTPINTLYTILQASNRLITVNNTAYQYDANGNIISDGIHRYQYNARNRLTQVDDNHQYFYNASNRRVKKVSDGKTTFYGWDNDRIYAEYDANGQAIQETVYFGSTPIALLKDDAIYRIYADQINTPRLITDQNNTTLWAWESKPFGETLPNEDVDGDGLKLSYNLRFPGQYYDQETGMHYKL